MTDPRCESCRAIISPETIESRAALVYPRQMPKLCLCPVCARSYREATDRIKRRKGALLDGKRTFPPLRSADPHGPKVLPERYQWWAKGMRAPTELGDPGK